MAIRRVHHLNCATMCPRVPARWMGQHGKARAVAHCLLLETDSDGLILVDTGLGLRDIADPQRLPATFRWVLRPQLVGAETAHAQIIALGFRPNDVRHILLTHLDLDHAGGIIDFPDATIHVHRDEHHAAMERIGRDAQRRYRPAQWAHAPKWALYQAEGDTWRDLPAIARLRGVSEDIGLLPMFGHTHGHSAAMVRHTAGWLVHAGDAYFHRATITSETPVPSAVRFFEKSVETDRAARLASIATLIELKANHPDVNIFCAHDPVELQAFTTVTE